MTPVVIVTAHGCIPDAVAAMKLGAADVIPKPVSPATLREVVARALARPSPDQRGPQHESSKTASDTILFTEDLARTRRALDRCDFDDAEFFLRIADTLNPGSPEILRLRDDLRDGERHPKGSRIVRWGNSCDDAYDDVATSLRGNEFSTFIVISTGGADAPATSPTSAGPVLPGAAKP